MSRKALSESAALDAGPTVVCEIVGESLARTRTQGGLRKQGAPVQVPKEQDSLRIRTPRRYQ